MLHFTSDFYNIHWRPRIPVFDVQHPCVPYLMSPSPSSRILESQVPTHASQCPSPTFIHSPEWPLTHMSTDLRESFSQGFVEKASICGCCWVHNLFPSDLQRWQAHLPLKCFMFIKSARAGKLAVATKSMHRTFIFPCALSGTWIPLLDERIQKKVSIFGSC